MLFISTRGEQCCEPLRGVDKPWDEINEFDFLMLSIGQEPPKEWIKNFKVYPETDEQRLVRLSGGRMRRNSDEAADESPLKPTTLGNAKATLNDETAVDFYYHLKTYWFFDVYYMKVTDLICLAKETEVFFKIIKQAFNLQCVARYRSSTPLKIFLKYLNAKGQFDIQKVER